MTKFISDVEQHHTRPRFKDSNFICYKEIEGVCYFGALKSNSAQTIWQLSIALLLFILAFCIVFFLKRFRYLAIVPLALGSFIIYFFISTTYFFTDSPIDDAEINRPVTSMRLLSSESMNSIECKIIDLQAVKVIISQKQICVDDWCITPMLVKEHNGFVVISDQSNSIILANQRIGKMAPGIHYSASQKVDLSSLFCSSKD